MAEPGAMEMSRAIVSGRALRVRGDSLQLRGGMSCRRSNVAKVESEAEFDSPSPEFPQLIAESPFCRSKPCVCNVKQLQAVRLLTKGCRFESYLRSQAQPPENIRRPGDHKNLSPLRSGSSPDWGMARRLKA